jgi:hypothetical protein
MRSILARRVPRVCAVHELDHAARRRQRPGASGGVVLTLFMTPVSLQKA